MTTKYKGISFQHVLSVGEYVLWIGRPQQGLMLRAHDLFMIPFSLLWGGFAVVWTLGATAAGGCFGLFGLPFVAAGCYFIFGRFIVDAYQRANTHYGLTTDRIIIFSEVYGQQIKSLGLETLTEITLNLKSDGTGTIIFGPEHPMNRTYRGFYWPGTQQTLSPTFEGVPYARDVYDQIRQAQKNLLT
jgi:hypothetical protein